MYGISTYNLKEGKPYTLKFDRDAGKFHFDKFEKFLKVRLRGAAKVSSIIRRGVIGLLGIEDVYITVVPERDISLDYIKDKINKIIYNFRSSYFPPRFGVSNLYFIDMIPSTGIKAIRKEASKSKLPGWAKQLSMIAGMTIVGAFTISMIIKKI